MVACVTIDGTKIVKSCVEGLLLVSPTRMHSQVYLATLQVCRGRGLLQIEEPERMCTIRGGKHQTILWQISTSKKIHLHVATYAELCCLDWEALVNYV